MIILLSMIVRYLDIVGITISPFKADPILIVYPYRVLPLSVAV